MDAEARLFFRALATFSDFVRVGRQVERDEWNLDGHRHFPLSCLVFVS